MAFHVGQKVEYVGWTAPWYLRWAANNIPIPGVKVGDIFTVAAVYNHGWGRKAIDLIEVPWPASRGADHYPGWISYAFRPVVERKTDISELEKLLIPANHKENVCGQGGERAHRVS